MNKKRAVFMCKLPIVSYVILGVMCAVMIPFAVLSILRVAEVGTLYSFNPAFDIVAAVAEVLCTVFILLIATLTRYVVTPQYFIFQRVIPTRVLVDRLLLIRHEVSSDMMVLYYADSAAPDGVRFVVLRVFPARRADIVAAIQRVNPHVSYEMFDNARNEKND